MKRPEYTLVYSPQRRTIGLSVERDGGLTVRAPTDTPLEHIEAVLEKKKFWLYQKLNAGRKYAPGRTLEAVSGESVLYLGQHYPLELTDDAGPQGLRFDGGFWLARSRRAEAASLFRSWFVAQAREVLTPRVRTFAAALGVQYRRVGISEMRYRWGSCTPGDNLNFNWRIVKAPPEVVDYLVVHELAHLLEPNHTRRFWTLVGVQLPRFREARSWLREHGALLEVDFLERSQKGQSKSG